MSRHQVAGNSGNPMKLMMGFFSGLLFLYFVWVSRNIPKAGLENVQQLANVRIEETPALVKPILKSQDTEKRKWTRKPGRRYVWIDVTIDGKDTGRITAEVK